MTDGRHEELHRFVKERAGDAYRTAFHYRHAIYVRDDLATPSLETNLPAVFEKLRDRTALLPEEAYPPLGPADATAEIHDGGVILHFPEGPNEGTIVSLDHEAARRLTGFVAQCQTILGSTPEATAEADYRSSTPTD